jgi:phenylpropionate dioxygenase-like ring-hydroxylating dioxygenase large terminal subunit
VPLPRVGLSGSDGTVKDIPVQPEGNHPISALQQHYDVVSADGMLWLYWGAEGRRESDCALCLSPQAT